MVDMSNVLTLTQKELNDARRNRWFMLYTVAFAGLTLALFGVGTTAGSFSACAGGSCPRAVHCGRLAQEHVGNETAAS